MSLLGFEPHVDYLAIVKEARGRRLFPAEADRSLLLLKATATMPHGGGRRLDVDSDDYRVLRRWIARGAAFLRGPFEMLLNQLITSCKTGHQAVNFGFNVVKTPETPPFSNQDFSARAN